jgi:hypothetical protein
MVTTARRDTEVKADRSVFSTSDWVAVPITCQIGFGFPHIATLVWTPLAAS